jgi:replicative DNA helicase
LPLRTLLEQFLDALSDTYRAGVLPSKRRVPFRTVDTTVRGLCRGDLLVLESDSGSGTTSLALNMTLQVALREKLPVLFFELGMDSVEITRLLIATESGIDPGRMRNGSLVESDWPKLSYTIDRLGHAPIFVDGDNNATVTEIRAKAFRLRNSVGRLGLVVIDCVQMLRGEPLDKAMVSGVATTKVSWALKSLAADLETPVVAVSQLSRRQGRLLKRQPLAAALTRTGAFDAGADLVLVLGRDELGLRGGQTRTGDIARRATDWRKQTVLNLDHRGRDFDFQTEESQATQQSLPF